MTRPWARFPAAMVAGAAAIILNTLALKAADFVSLETARGGLLRLLRPMFPLQLRTPAGDPRFQVGFHLVVGMLMALVYAYALEPRLKGGPWSKGLLYAFGVWLLNALVVLPATGEGFAGSAHLGFAGMGWFAAAHTLFFVWLSGMYGWLTSSQSNLDDGHGAGPASEPARS